MSMTEHTPTPWYINAAAIKSLGNTLLPQIPEIIGGAIMNVMRSDVGSPTGERT